MTMRRGWVYFFVALTACDPSAPAGSDGGTSPMDAAPTDAARPDGATVDAAAPPSDVPRAVRVARATEIPPCTTFVDAASAEPADGSAESPYPTIAAAVEAAASGAVICVAEGTYAEAIVPLDKYFTLAGGFQSGQGFRVRDSSVYVSRAQGDGTNAFVRIEGDVAPTEGQLTAIDGFEITGYSQGVVRDTYFPQRFDLTHNFIHDNACATDALIGGGFWLSNVSGTIAFNVIASNACARGGGGALGDSTNTNEVAIVGNRVEANAGTETDISHGGGLYLFGRDLTITANEFTGNTVTAWGGGLYVGAQPPAQQTTARLSWNVYRDNRAQNAGGGFFCDDGATCLGDHELFDANCGGNVLLDSSYDDAAPTVARFDHMTNHGALVVGCGAPGAGVIINKQNVAADAYSVTSSVFWGNADGEDLNASCDLGCDVITVTVAYSALQRDYADGGVEVVFGEGVLDGADPRFVDASAGDFHLQSTFGHWTPAGPASDAADSPALSAGDPAGPVTEQPDRAGDRSEMGAYGNSAEASYVR